MWACVLHHQTCSFCVLFSSLVCEFLVRAGDEWWTHRKALSAVSPSELGTPSFSGDPPHSCFESSLSSEHATDLWTHPQWPVSTPRECTLPPQPLCTPATLLIDGGSRWLGVPTEEGPRRPLSSCHTIYNLALRTNLTYQNRLFAKPQRCPLASTDLIVSRIC